MSIAPIITFKAGACDLDTSTSPPTVKPKPTPGYIYIYPEDDLMHFCWRPRSAPLDQPELDLVMVPTDGTFTPYKPTSAENPSNSDRATNGRIYVLKFSSSSQRHLFWLQSRSQHETQNSDWFSARDLKLGSIVNALLQGEDVNVSEAMTSLRRQDRNGGGGGDDDDEPMEDVEGTDHGEHRPSGSGGAGPDATGGDVREEGQESREGGADGGRAASASDSQAIVQNFLRSLGNQNNNNSGASEDPFTTLTDLLNPPSTLPLIDSADSDTVDNLLSFLPTSLLLLAGDLDEVPAEDDSETAQAVLMSLSIEQKKDILRRVLRSPQFTQSLGSLTVALRDGGLPTISEALNIKVESGGYMRRGGVPLGGGDAVRAFLEGVKKHVEERRGNDGDDKMETD